MTFSIVAFDPSDGSIGLASQSHFFAVGAVVGDAEAGVGAVVSQAFANTDWPHEGLAMLRDGASPDEVVKTLVAADPLADYRQLIVMDAAGVHATNTGVRCAPCTSTTVSDGVAAAGNMLTSEGVVPAMLVAFRESRGALSDKLLTALAAAERAGGEARGSQSAYLKVVSGQRSDRPWRNVLADLRVDDHVDPVEELIRIKTIHEAFSAIGGALFAAPLVIGDPTDIVAAEAHRMIEDLAEAATLLDDNREADLWRAVIQIRSGDQRAGSALLSDLIAVRPQLSDFALGLEQVGILPAQPRPAG